MLAMVFTLVADGTLFVSLIFGVLYPWLAAPNWPPAEVMDASPGVPLLVLAALLAGPLVARGALAALHRGRAVMQWLALQAAALLLAGGAVVALILGALPDPRSHG